MYEGVCYTNGSYFLSEDLRNNNGMERPLICGHSDAGGGQWLYPDGTTCTSTSSPIQCTHDGNATELRRVATFGTNHELRYTCCLPHSCNNSNMITANIYCKSFKIIVISYFITS